MRDLSNFLGCEDGSVKVISSLDLGLDPAEERLVARLVVALQSLVVRWSASHRDVSSLLLVSDDSSLDQCDARV